jgi:glycosyltransferase involved in cell wall biosynthesis
MNAATPRSDTSTRLRVLHVVPTYFPAVRYGGPIRSVHGLVTALVRRGHEVHVYTTSLDGESDLNVPLEVPVELDGALVHYFPVPRLRRLCWSPGLARRLRESIDSFDVVHLHSVFLLPTRAAARTAASAGVPYILAPRGMLIRKMILGKSRWIKTLWISLVERRSICQAAALHVTADVESEDLRGMFSALPAEIANIPNGVECPSPHLPRSATPFAHLPPRYALFLSRISWKKGLDRLIAAWREIPELPLVIAGNDEEGYQPKLEALAQSLGLSERVHFIGPVADAHKWSLYESADLFVLPSYSENFGNVVAEAMAMACPVVISPEVGIAELVKAEGAGIVTGCDPSVLAAAIRHLLSDDAARRELGRRGQQTVRARLSWDSVAARTEELYRRVIHQQGAPSRSVRAAVVAR